jgi:pseudaminic acid biosynthesis-associated methylase
MSTEQLKIWNSGFGNEYTDRNTFDYHTRTSAWDTMIGDLPIETVLEVGCNKAYNLQAIKHIRNELKLFGVEPNDYARGHAQELFGEAIHTGNATKLPFQKDEIDLVFTANVLIHVSIDDLPAAINEINRVASKYILCVEYFDRKETQIHYRGHDNALWKRDFCSWYERALPSLKLVKNGFWNQQDNGFDDSHWWLWEK